MLAEILTSKCTAVDGDLTTSLSANSSSDWVVRFSGHSDSGGYKNLGPFHHVSHVARVLAVKPSEGKSAGFE